MARQAQFDLEAVGAAGLEVVRHDGWAAVTLASTARALDVTPMALYRVVADANELRRIVADHAGRALLPHPVGPVVDDLHRWAVDAHDRLRRLPGLAGYVIGEWTELPTWLTIVETFLDQAAREQIEGPRAVHTVNAVFAYVLARAQLLDSTTPRRRLGPLRTGSYPHISANVAHYQTAQTETAFRFGLDALTDGLRYAVASR